MDQVILKLQDHPNILKFLYHVSSSKGKRIVTAIALLGAGAYFALPSKKKSPKRDGKKSKSVLNKEFLSQLKDLLTIVIPSWHSKQVILLAFLTASLVARTFISIYVAILDGKIVKSIVNHKGKEFMTNLILWFGIAIPATYINSIIRYFENAASLSFRTRLATYCYDLYMKGDTYYRIGNLDNRLTNVDQCLTEDVSRFSFKLAHLYSQLTKPTLDFFLMTWSLTRMARETTTGGGGIAFIFAMIVIGGTGQILKAFQPPFGKMAAEQADLEGDLRFAHSRLITNAEEVAFFRGSEVEKRELNTKYLALAKHMARTFRVRIFYHMLEGFFMKYVWSSTGLIMIAMPSFLFSKDIQLVDGEVIAGRTRNFITAKKLLIDAADACERLMLSVKEINELGGYTTRVWEMVHIFKSVQQGEYQSNLLTKLKTSNFEITNGTVVEANCIKFDRVPIVSPAGDVLVKSLSFETQPGQHLLITGPNGCGKSSLFRILGGLWPALGGSVHRPNMQDIFYLPQRPYLAVGNLRDQVIYPDTVAVMKSKGYTDDDLTKLLDIVSLTHILEREGGWEAEREWKDVLSGGEKQRIGMARIFYHKPKYAILDECTSAVSIDVEGKMYQTLVDLNITLLTVSHRPSLWKYHKMLLQFDGEGGYKYTALNAEERMSLKEEKTQLEEQLSTIPKMQTRLEELCMLLGEDSIVLKDHAVKTKGTN
jgi:ABC-type uncharacterized transport system fused permease/ATPase subunit